MDKELTTINGDIMKKYNDYEITLINPGAIMDTPYFDFLSKLAKEEGLTIHIGNVENEEVTAPEAFNSDKEGTCL